MNTRRGFTLIEVLVVVAILGILAAIVVPRIMDRPDEAKRVAAKADIGAIVQALKLYRLDNGGYPTTDQGLVALVQRPTTNPIPGNWPGYEWICTLVYSSIGFACPSRSCCSTFSFSRYLF